VVLALINSLALTAMVTADVTVVVGRFAAAALRAAGM
jgi:hypothetical protein